MDLLQPVSKHTSEVGHKKVKYMQNDVGWVKK